MNRELRDLQTRLAEAEQSVRLAIGEGNVTEAEKHMEEVRTLRKQIAMLEELDAQAKADARSAMPAGEVRDRREFEARYTEAFVKAVAQRGLTADDREVIAVYNRSFRAAMHEGGVTTDPDGDVSVVVPEDVQTRINRLMREFDDLSEEVRVETVTTLSGSRVLEKDSDMVPFEVVGEYSQIPETDNPQFTTLSYKLKKFGGILPITDELLADSDQNILSYVTDWCARKAVVTRNTKIIALLSTLTPVELADLDAVKRVLNVSLDPAISRSAVILTNQDGYHWLDTQKDEMGRYLLTDDPTQPGRRLFKGRPVRVVSNRHLPSVAGSGTVKAPMIIGNLRQLAVVFTRGRFELASTRIGGQAWRTYSTELRAIMREDYQLWDQAAAVYGLVAL